MPDTPPFAVRFRRRASDAPPAASDAELAGAPASEAELPIGGSPYRLAGEATPVSEDDRPLVYRQGLAFAARTFAITELAASERFHLRDQLDRKASVVPQLVAQALAVADMHRRRSLYLTARQAVTDCVAILDLLGERGTVGPIDLAPAAALAEALLDSLAALTVPPLQVR